MSECDHVISYIDQSQYKVMRYQANHKSDCPACLKLRIEESPKWMRRPSGPGVWLLFSKDGQFKYNALALDADDIARGAPFMCDLVFGPIEEPFAIALEDSLPNPDGSHTGQIEIL